MVNILIIWIHFLADFVCQTDEMATNKSTSLLYLGLHVITYTLIMCVLGVTFALTNGVLHFIIDYVTSKCTSALWRKNKKHWFFTMIGFDQALHLTILILTAKLIR